MTLIDVIWKRENTAVRCHAEAVLYEYGNDHNKLHALSLIGPEQAVRAIAAGCCSREEKDRATLELRGPHTTVRAKFVGKWRPMAKKVGQSYLHLVALPEDSPAVIPENNTSFASLYKAIYAALLKRYTTPLIPFGITGQSSAEVECARKWCSVICAEIVSNTNHWGTLRGHPDQGFSDTIPWANAGLLKITQENLDALVSKLVRTKKLDIAPIGIGSDNPACLEDFNTYLATFAPTMAERVARGLRPLFNPETDSLSQPILELRNCQMRPLKRQAVAVEASIRQLQRDDFVIVNGEMGVGKTPMGGFILRAEKTRTGKLIRAAITAPNQLVKKWAKHIRSIMPGCEVYIVHDFRDLAKVLDRGEQVADQVFIFPRDKGKLGYAWRAAATVRNTVKVVKTEDGTRRAKITEFRCPKCGHIILDEKENPATLEYFVGKGGKLKARRGCPKVNDDLQQRIKDRINGVNRPGGRHIGLLEARSRYPAHMEDEIGLGVDRLSLRLAKDSGRCNCGEQLWQAHTGQLGPFTSKMFPVPGIHPRRMAPCTYLRKRGIRFTHYIADEVHELKGADTLQGMMMAEFCMLSDKAILLTGTLTGGYATNLLYLLWRIMARRLVKDGMTHNREGQDAFVKKYGILQEQKRYIQDDPSQTMKDLVQGRGKKVSAYTKALPGMSPLLYVNFLLDCTIFIRLHEMSANLPDFKEKVHVVRLTKEQDDAMFEMQGVFEEHRKSHRPCRAWSAARSCFLRWVDKPWIDPYTIWDYTEDGIPVKAFDVPQLPKIEYAKERRIRRLVHRNKLRGERGIGTGKTWVFTELTGQDGEPAWDWMDYLQRYLERHGYRAIVLRAEGQGGPNPIDREEWIAKHAPFVDVVISNPTLVKTGLDLYDFPNIIYAYCGDNTYSLRQASRRAWRIGQKATCLVDYLVYHGSLSKSVQSAALSLMSQKMASALAIEGDLSAEGLASMAPGEDMSTQLAKYIAGQIEVEDVKTAFAKYRERLEASLPDLGSAINEPVDEIFNVVPADSIPIDPLPKAEDIMQSLGVPAEILESPPSAVTATEARILTESLFGFEPGLIATQVPVMPKSPAIRERKTVRLEALCSLLGAQPESSDGDVHLIGGQRYHLVGKKRSTVRERNFIRTNEQYENAMIAFVEMDSERGPTAGHHTITHDGQVFAISFMPVDAYLVGERTPSVLEGV